MKLSIVIPTHERPLMLRRLLESIREQNLPLDNYEVNIVSNFQDDNTAEVVEEFVNKININLYVSGRLGANRARNTGIKKSNADIVLLLDDDCVLLHDNYLNEVLEAHIRYPECVAIGGVYSNLAQSNIVDKAYVILTNEWQKLEFFGSYQSVKLVGGNVSYKRQKLIECELYFDESMVYGGTETEFHVRLQKNGYKTYLLNYLRVGHSCEMTYEQLVKKAYLQGADHFNQNYYDRLPYEGLGTISAVFDSNSKEEYLEVIKALEVYQKAHLLTNQQQNLETIKSNISSEFNLESRLQ